MNSRIHSIENLIASDPGGRNIFSLVIADQLRLAAESLIKAKHVGIVSGFYIPQAGAGETDGPPGAFALGKALQKINIKVDYITDELNAPLFHALSIKPITDVSQYLNNEIPTHLVSIERLGRGTDGRYRNMNGQDITSTTPPLDGLFLEAQSLHINTIGIGDGGNEIGMGKVFKNTLVHIRHGNKIATIVATDICIAAGISNWGAYGLVGAISVLVKRDLLPTAKEAAQTMERIVHHGGAVDGATHQNETTIDGISLSQSIGMLESIRRHIAPSPLQSDKPTLIGILGYGETGRAAADLLLQKGYRIRISDHGHITVANKTGIESIETGQHSLQFLQDCNLVIASPGVGPESSILQALHRNGIAVMSEMELAYQLSNRHLIAVTGTTGKRTTVEFIQKLFKLTGREITIGGNKGKPLSALLMDENVTDPIAVAVSSFQLENVVHFCPQVAIILNIYEEHLDRHRSVAEYMRIKSRVFMNQGPDSSTTAKQSNPNQDVLILPFDDPRLRSLADKHRGKTFFISTQQEVEHGAWISDGKIMLNTTGKVTTIGRAPTQKSLLDYPENLLSSILSAKLSGIKDDELSSALRVIK